MVDPEFVDGQVFHQTTVEFDFGAVWQRHARDGAVIGKHPQHFVGFRRLCAGAALRFLLTRLYDRINHDPNALVRPKDPRDFSKRLRFHLKTKSPAEYGL